MFTLREVITPDALGSGEGPMIRDAVIRAAEAATGRTRDDVERIVCALRRGEHATITPPDEVAGRCGLATVRVEWLGPNSFDSPERRDRFRGEHGNGDGDW